MPPTASFASGVPRFPDASGRCAGRSSTSPRAGATGRQLENVALAVSEAVANVVRHAYPPGSPGTVTVDARVDDHVIEVIVCDEGSGMPAPSEQPGSGLGLLIIARVAESLELKDAAPGVELRMTFPLG